VYERAAVALRRGPGQADTGFSRLLARNGAKCLDVRAQDNYFSPGARIQQWDCSGAAEQQWSFHPYATVPMPGNPGVNITLYQIKSQRSGLCMEADAGGVHAQIRQDTCGNGQVPDLAHQLWWSPAVPSASAYVNLKAWSNNSLCADIAGASDGNGAMLQLYNCTGNTNQQFYGLSVLTS
jgi:endo-1,4-beta-xylanase